MITVIIIIIIFIIIVITYIAEEESNGMIQNLCHTHDYIVLANLVSSKRPNFIYRTFTKLHYILTCIYE